MLSLVMSVEAVTPVARMARLPCPPRALSQLIANARYMFQNGLVVKRSAGVRMPMPRLYISQLAVIGLDV